MVSSLATRDLDLDLEMSGWPAGVFGGSLPGPLTDTEPVRSRR